MQISLIVAMASNRIIGNKGKIPWKIPGEQKMFKKITLGHAVIMGRKTFESIGRPLPERTNIIITRQAEYLAPGCIITHNLDQALAACAHDEDEAFILGGGQLYIEALPLADRIYLTLIPKVITGDTYFPEFDEADFKVTASKTIDGIQPYHFLIYERIKYRG